MEAGTGREPDRYHEWRAISESLARTGQRVRPIGYARGGLHWLFEYVNGD